MYSKLKKYIAACCAFLIVSFFMTEAKAAVASEDEAESTTSEETPFNGTIDLDVPSYLVRYLYREPDADEVPIKHWYDGWGWSLYWNPDILGFSSSSYVNKFNMSVKGVGMALSKDFNKKSGIRLGATFSSVEYDNEVKKSDALKRATVTVDYMWNLSNTYYGYDLHRTTEWLLTAGFKAGKLISTGETTPVDGDMYYGANVGIQFRKNISNDWSFFVEPQFAFFTDQYDNNKTFYEIDPGLNLLVGLYFRMGKPKMQILEHENDILGNSYFQTYAGIVNGAQTYGFTSGDDFQRHHMNFGFNIGSWFNPSLGFRFGYFENIMGIGPNANLLSYSGTSRQTYRGGRAELVMNPLTILIDKTSIGRLGLDFSVGYEVGTINKHKVDYANRFDKDQQQSYLAHGMTFATQLKYYLSKNYALFAEGRYSNPMYKADEADGLVKIGDKLPYGDMNEHMLSWAIGMEYYISTFDRYSRFGKWDKHESREIPRLSSRNRWYMELAGGVGAATHWGERFDGRSSVSAFGAIGLNYNDYSGIRLRGGGTRKFLKDDRAAKYVMGNGYQFAIGMDYMFNLTNLWWGRDEENTRWSDIYLFAGPTLQIDPHNLKRSFSLENAYGAEAGIQLTRRLSKGVDLFVEPRYEYNIGASDRWNVLAGIKMYQYREKNRHYRDSLASHDREQWFMEVSGGAGRDVAGAWGSNKGGTSTPDISARIGLGYRFNPVSSLRFNMQHIGYNLYKGNANGTQSFEFSLDYMANFINLWYGNNPHRKMALYGYFGPVVNPDNLLSSKCTSDIAYDWKMGLEGGLQLVYSPFRNVSLFLEPRASYYVSDYIQKSGKEAALYARDEHFDLYAGMIFYNQPNRLPARGYNTTDLDSLRSWFFEFAGGAAVTPSGHKNNIVNCVAPSGYLSVGHYLSNYSSWRARMEISDYLHPQNEDYETKMMTGFSLDYMYNLSNNLLGLNPYRRFDLSLYGGPVAEYYNSENNKYDEWDYGANFGGQLAWHVNNYMDFFGEGRFVASTMHHTRYEAMTGFRLYQNKQSTTQFRDSMTQHGNTWFLETAGSAGKSFTDAQKKMDYGGKIAVGYRFSPISSVRFNSALFARQENHKHQSVGQFGFDYMANLMNLWYGADPYRRVNLHGFVGPALLVNNFTDADNNLELNAAYQAGVQLTLGLTDNIDLLLEPRYSSILTGDNKNLTRGDIYAGLVFYNQRGWVPAHDFPEVNTDNERGWYAELAGGATFSPDGRKSGINNHINSMGHAALGHYFGNYASVRMRAGMGYNRNITSDKDRLRWVPEVSLDYIHNISNMLLGINPYRRFDFSLYAGPMVQIGGLLGGNLKPFYGVNGGSQLAWHINNYVDLIAEPRVSYLLQDEFHSRFEALGGVRVYQNKSKNLQYVGTDKPHANTWFLEMAAGAGTSAINQLRPDLGLKTAVGYRYNPYSSLRMGANFALGKVNGSTSRSLEVNGDYMLNLLNVFYGVNPERRVDLRAFVGGSVNPDNFLSSKKTHMVYGAQWGLQGTYAINDHVDFMMEPRMETFLNNGHTPRFDGYAGVIFYNRRGLLPMREYKSTDIDDHFTWFSEIGGGLSFNYDGRLDNSYLNHLDIGGHGAVGMHFNNYMSARVRGTLITVRDREMTKDKRHMLPELSLEYMHNMTNTLMGYNPYRRFDLNVFAGPTALLKGLSHFHWDPYWGVSGGGQLSWHMNDRWDLFGELRTVISSNFDSRLEAFTGLAYRYNKRSMTRAHYDVVPDRIYTQLLAGGQLFDFEHFGSNGFKTYSQLPTINFNLGYRFNKMLSAQAGIYSDHFTVDVDGKKKSKNESGDVYSYGVRGEGVVNLINLFNPSYDANENRFNWSGSVGGQLGRTRGEDNKLKYGFGVTAATQAQYRVFSHSWVVAEVRGQAINSQHGIAVPVSASLGMMYDFNQGTPAARDTKLSNFYLQGGFGMFESKTGTMEGALGYDLSPVHSVRIMGDLSFKPVDRAGRWLTLSPGYVCNMTNLFWGHDENNRHVDFSLLTGIDYYMQGVTKDLVHSTSYMGVNAGAQLTFNINKYCQLYAEPRFSYSFVDQKVANRRHEGLNLQTNFGMKLRVPDFFQLRK